MSQRLLALGVMHGATSSGIKSTQVHIVDAVIVDAVIVDAVIVDAHDSRCYATSPPVCELSAGVQQLGERTPAAASLASACL